MIIKSHDLIQNLDYDKIVMRFFAILGFGLSFSPSVVSIALGFMALLFLLERRYKDRFLKISKNPLSYIVLLIVLLHIMGFLWTSDFQMASETLSRAWKFLLIPFFMMYVKKENIPLLLSVFLLGMVVSEVATYLIWLGFIEPFGKATQYLPSPFMYHPYYTVYAALSAGLLMHYFFFDRPASRWKIALMAIFLLTIIVNLSFMGGRGGQVGFFVLLFIFFIVYFKGQWIRSFLVFTLVSSILFALAYQFVPIFKERANKAVFEVIKFEEGLQKSSLGIRLALNINYFEAFMDAPLLGHGTGGYFDAYEKVNANSPYKTHLTQPHNMFLLILVQFGILGGIIFLSMFAYMLWYGWQARDTLRAFKIAFPFFWLVIMLVNWYLYSHHTLYAFLYFSAILYGTNLDKRLENTAEI